MGKQIPSRRVPVMTPEEREFVRAAAPLAAESSAAQAPEGLAVGSPVAPPAPAPKSLAAAPRAAESSTAQVTDSQGSQVVEGSAAQSAPAPKSLAAAPRAAESSAAQVTDSQGPQVAGGSAAQSAPPLKSRAVISRADGRTLRRIQIYFEDHVALKLRHHCVDHDVDMSEFVNGLVDRALPESDPSQR